MQTRTHSPAPLTTCHTRTPGLDRRNRQTGQNRRRRASGAIGDLPPVPSGLQRLYYVSQGFDVLPERLQP